MSLENDVMTPEVVFSLNCLCEVVKALVKSAGLVGANSMAVVVMLSTLLAPVTDAEPIEVIYNQNT